MKNKMSSSSFSEIASQKGKNDQYIVLFWSLTSIYCAFLGSLIYSRELKNFIIFLNKPDDFDKIFARETRYLSIVPIFHSRPAACLKRN
ncbi:hypothetical protein A2V82_07935 [candidate division KSB1 bacterium RBG_16_48_16]|nr:MAG: hypothetical protein A2V82_07935 [candidate division KSB1 bacterium RBG_16_48_16]